jgi:Rieske Fe-S protein
MTEGTSRRLALKVLASIPLAFTFGLVASPMLRFLRPTIKPLDLLGPSDQPAPLKPVEFKESDFPEPWTCIPFTFAQTYKEYNPEGMEVRKVPGFAVKLPTGDIVAYSRICPHLGCIFNFVKEPDEIAKGYNYASATRPMFCCPCHLSVYDILNGGKVVSGPAPRPPRSFTIKKEGDTIRIASLEAGGIA